MRWQQVESFIASLCWHRDNAASTGLCMWRGRGIHSHLLAYESQWAALLLPSLSHMFKKTQASTKCLSPKTRLKYVVTSPCVCPRSSVALWLNRATPARKWVDWVMLWVYWFSVSTSLSSSSPAPPPPHPLQRKPHLSLYEPLYVRRYWRPELPSFSTPHQGKGGYWWSPQRYQEVGSTWKDTCRRRVVFPGNTGFSDVPSSLSAGYCQLRPTLVWVDHHRLLVGGY